MADFRRKVATQRMIGIPVDDLLRMLGDYLGTDTVPIDSKPVRLVRKPDGSEWGLIIDSAHYKTGGEIRVDFQIRRFTPTS